MATPEVVPVLEAVVEIVVDDKLLDAISISNGGVKAEKSRRELLIRFVCRRFYSPAVCVRA